jgi:transcriptional regulator with XRE-family HTH domain
VEVNEIWKRFGNKEYREEFVAAQVKLAIPFQIRAMLKHRGWTQEKLAQQSGLEQGVISRAANPNYGNLTLNTIIRIAAGFDVGFIGKFAPFSELGEWFVRLSERELGSVPSFPEESASRASVASKETDDHRRSGGDPV